MKTCYLAGPFTTPDWRDRVLAEVSGIDFLDPRTDSRQGAIFEFVGDDLNHAAQCDICFVYAPNGRGEIGAAIEAAYALAKGRTVVLCAEAEFVHPMLVGIAARVFFGLETGIRYLRNLAKFDKETDAAYAMWEER